MPETNVAAAAAVVAASAAAKTKKKRSNASTPAAAVAVAPAQSCAQRHELIQQEQQKAGIAQAIVAIKEIGSNNESSSTTKKSGSNGSSKRKRHVEVNEQDDQTTKKPKSAKKKKNVDTPEQPQPDVEAVQLPPPPPPPPQPSKKTLSAGGASSSPPSPPPNSITVLIRHVGEATFAKPSVLEWSPIPVSGSGNNIKAAQPTARNSEKFAYLLLPASHDIVIEPLKTQLVDLQYGIQFHGGRNSQLYQWTVHNWEPLLREGIVVHATQPQVQNIHLLVQNAGSSTMVIKEGDPLVVVGFHPMPKKLNLVYVPMLNA